ncbi:DUF7059 domain-containing protein [Homoserinibacter sp. YIM 151385]|uniref:DUF7059 domain-containing protein n=1 Tax=Homoserinibacter sp. YIM 151385 TaxID=2985506 RepID=UPI0022F04CC2|nr:methyltransferase [Homoserinibacter sp. YIM 151385]WBU39079.1 methyltransferase [Homoserinibacter sp. YIM 151385]
MHDTPRLDPELIGRLRRDLDAAGLTVDALRELWGDAADGALERGDRVPALRALRGADSALSVLARLLVLGTPVGRVELDRALPSLGSAGALELGLAIAVAGDAGLLAPALDLRPSSVVDGTGVTSWWIASDLGELALGGALRTDHVLGIGGASATLAALQLPAEGGSVLDLGTGSGIQALHAARWADRVIATDVSERALAFARFNAALNGVDRIEFRLGSLYEPVAGERFDRIVTNPPFVITPRREGVPAYEYRDGGMVGDALVASVVEGAAAHLAPGGSAQLLGNWEYRDGRSGLDRAAAWARGAGLEHWIVEREVLDPARYAETWIRDGGTRPGTPEHEALVDAWLDDFAERRVDEVGFGYVLLRRPAAPTGPGTDAGVRLAVTERIAEGLGENLAGIGAHLAQALAGWDAVAGLDDAQLMEQRLRVAPDVTEERSHWPGEEHPSVILFRQGTGFGRAVHADTGLAAVVGVCDGELALGAIVDAVAGLLDADPAALRAQLAPRIRELVRFGMLLPLER